MLVYNFRLDNFGAMAAVSVFKNLQDVLTYALDVTVFGLFQNSTTDAEASSWLVVAHRIASCVAGSDRTLNRKLDFTNFYPKY